MLRDADAKALPSWGLVGVYGVGVVLVAVFGQDRNHLELFSLGCAVMAGGTLGLYRLDGLPMRAVLALALLARLAVFFWLPGLSDDGYRYLWDGMVQHAGINPFDYTPVELTQWHDTPIYPLLNSNKYYSVYPPLSQALFWLATSIEYSDWRVWWYSWKALCLGAEIGTLLLLRVVGRKGLLLYALYPLIVVELVGQAHTEAIMVLGLALAAWAYKRQHTAALAGGLVIAALTKLYPVLLIPVLLRTRGERRSVLFALLVGGVVTVLYWRLAQLEHVVDSLRLYTQYFEFNAGLYYAVKAVAGFLGLGDVSKQLGPVLAGVYLCMYGGLLAAYLMNRLSALPFMLATLSGYLVFSTTVHPWYLSGVLVLLPFALQRGWAWQWLALLALGTYARYVEGPYFLAVWMGWGGAALLYLYTKWRSRSSGGSYSGEVAEKRPG